MSDIILTTFNSRYTHTSVALRYLYANLKELQKSAEILEFVINQRVVDAVEETLKKNPKIVGVGVYIWNALEVSEFIEIIKSVSPEITIILGGPEASYLPHRVDFGKADYIVKGEGDTIFYELCRDILNNNPPKERFLVAKMVDLSEIELPYRYYTDEDIKNRYIYVEASRGCPYSCEFCLSSIDKKVRNIDIDRFIEDISSLWDRGVRSFKFIDRTFNQGIKRANALMDFFLSKEPPYFIHFEVVPDNFPKSLRERIKLFPPASLQLEVGIQTLDAEISKNIYRKLDIDKIKDNLEFLENETKAHLHVDLIIGLPGESIEQFGKNLNLLYSMTKCEIQLGVLKKLSGTTIDRHDREWKMVYSSKPPYEILQNSLISFSKMQELKRFARFWDLYYNSGNFRGSMEYLFKDGDVFESFYKLSEWIYSQTKSTWQISLERLSYLLYRFFLEVLHVKEKDAKEMIEKDYMRVEGRKLPKFLKEQKLSKKREAVILFNKRQKKHLV